MKTIKKISACLVMALALAGCSRQDDRLKDGGGPHEITQIILLAQTNRTLLREENPATIRVGERLPLRVEASWAIPYVGDVTQDAVISVSDPALGDVDDKAVFTARKAGKVAIEATLRVAAAPGDHKVLGRSQNGAGATVVMFRDRYELTVTE